MPIHILPDKIASQIAAGEVIERPASVIKELVENSLDAGASHISIKVENAGRRLMEIADNGRGIPADELALALARHATSKLDQAEDLFNILTLGFRGEALASIASVSRLTLTSRTADAESGSRIQAEGGRVNSPQAIGVPQGTVVRVEDLFFNVPPRLKFMKTEATERHKIDEYVTRYALAYPDVRFQLAHGGKTTLQTSGSGDRREVLAGLYDIETARKMLEVIMDDGNMKATGYTSPTSFTRSNRKEITFFVNGRWVLNSTLTAALLKAYHTMLMVGRYPMTVLFLEIEPTDIDVNVHPTKAEVRFHHPDRVFSFVQRAIRRALLAYSPAPEINAGGWQNPVQSSHYFSQPDWKQPASQYEFESTPQTQGIAGNNTSIPGSLPFSNEQMPLLRLVGQVGAAYLVAEGPDGLYLVDQHAAHERILFERFRRQRSGQIPSQNLLQAATLELSPQASGMLNEQMALLNQLGFSIEAFGPNSFRIRAVPALFQGGDPLAAVRAVIEDIEEDETPLESQIEERLVARICKRMAVKAGQILSYEEQVTLLRDLEACQSPRTCPHGRPTMIHLPVDLLERQFGRKGSR